MAKKTANTRSAAQRNKPKTQKSIELVRQASVEKEVEVDSSPEQASSEVATSTTKAPAPVTRNGGTKTAVDTATASSTSASARLAARRQAAQKTQRSSVALITSEHYRYVRNDLMYIAILAIIMFSILVALFFVLR
jgi:cobalamin biosynthesis Mg chelatase CobN